MLLFLLLLLLLPLLPEAIAAGLLLACWGVTLVVFHSFVFVCLFGLEVVASGKESDLGETHMSIGHQDSQWGELGNFGS